MARQSESLLIRVRRSVRNALAVVHKDGVMPNGFVIMQIGDPALDTVFDVAIAPAIADAGLEAKRIDIDTAGGLLKSEIVDYLERSDIIVADLTNERPNCYLEVGYAMGLGRHRHLILSVRSDHLPGSAEHVAGGPKVHFDLAGYDLLMWSPNDLEAFRGELTQRIKRRLAITRDLPLVGPGVTSPTWVHELAEHGLARIHELVGRGYVKLAFGLAPPKIQRTSHDLLEAARGATIPTFGWPIGLVLDTEDDRPRTTGNGIKAEVIGKRWDEKGSYDLWELRTDGDFCMVQSLFEDQLGRPGAIFFNTRVVRATEAILYCARIYELLGVPPEAVVNLRLAHGGLKNRVLTSVGARILPWKYESQVDRVETEVTFELGTVAGDLSQLVKLLTAPMFELFDFFVLGDDVYTDIVDKFVKGQVT